MHLLCIVNVVIMHYDVPIMLYNHNYHHGYVNLNPNYNHLYHISVLIMSYHVSDNYAPKLWNDTAHVHVTGVGIFKIKTLKHNSTERLLVNSFLPCV